MGNYCDLIARILREYKEINIIEIFEPSSVTFELKGNHYGIIKGNDEEFPVIFAANSETNYPHHFVYNNTNGRLQGICLFEEGTLIKYIHTEEERIRLCIDRLIDLVSLSKSEIIDEYQKEFLYYWHKFGVVPKQHSAVDYQIYLDHSDEYQWLEQQAYGGNVVRITKPHSQFNDSKDMQQIKKTPALYLPIEDARKLLPPLISKPWDAHVINDIIAGLTYQRINPEAYSCISDQSYSHKEILLVFRLNNLYFGCIIKFKNPGTAKLLRKIENQISEVIPIDVSRCDFNYLNEQIGNSVHDERVVVVGAGSLGSYVVDELAHAGYKNIVIIDADEYEHPNIFRHRVKWFFTSCSKSYALKVAIEQIHPEINIRAIDKNLTIDNIDECIPPDAQIIIFTVGSSDVQLQLNKAFMKQAFEARVFYSWLEHDGKTSHVAAIRSTSEGCFECLFTDQDGHKCKNVINIADPSTLVYTRNGCGGTRIHYGNRTLLTASALVLTALEDSFQGNAIYSYINSAMHKQDFPQNSRCGCCGIREQVR